MKMKCYEFMEDLESKDLKKIANWFDDKSQVWIPPCAPIDGGRRIMALFRAIFHRYHELHWKVVEINEVAPNRFFYITESWGMINANTPYKNRILTDITFDSEGCIVHLSDYFKDMSSFVKA